MSFSHLKIVSFFTFLAIFLYSCGNTATESTSEAQPVVVKNTEEPAQTDIETIEFYSDSNKESMENILTKTITSGKTPVFFFTADWCKPCKEFKASMKYELVASSLKDVTLISIDIDNDKEGHASDYGVRAIPTFIIVDEEGNALNTITGAAWADNTPENISKAMAEFLED